MGYCLHFIQIAGFLRQSMLMPDLLKVIKDVVEQTIGESD